MQARSALFDLFGDHLRPRGGRAPVAALVRLLAGRPGPDETGQHEALIERFNGLFNQQRLVSIKTLFDLADHLERVSRGESFNVAMANRLAETISDVRLPQSHGHYLDASHEGVTSPVWARTEAPHMADTPKGGPNLDHGSRSET